MYLGKLFRVIREYADATRAGEEKLSNRSEPAESGYERMRRIDAAEEALFEYQGDANLPTPLLEFFAAESDKGCMTCWVTSNPNKRCGHAQGCRGKIDNWFAKREALVAFGEGIKAN